MPDTTPAPDPILDTLDDVRNRLHGLRYKLELIAAADHSPRRPEMNAALVKMSSASRNVTRAMMAIVRDRAEAARP